MWAKRSVDIEPKNVSSRILFRTSCHMWCALFGVFKWLKNRQTSATIPNKDKKGQVLIPFVTQLLLLLRFGFDFFSRCSLLCCFYWATTKRITNTELMNREQETVQDVDNSRLLQRTMQNTIRYRIFSTRLPCIAKSSLHSSSSCCTFWCIDIASSLYIFGYLFLPRLKQIP